MKNKAGRPRSNEEQAPKKQALINASSIKRAKLAAIKADVSLSSWIEQAINEKLTRE